MKLRHFLLALGLLAACIGSTHLWLQPSHAMRDDARYRQSSIAISELPAASVLASSTVLDSHGLRLHLANTSKNDVDIPIDLTLDAEGNLVADENLRVLMEFFLALDGEQEPAQIRALFLATMATQCNAACVDDAATLFDQYQDYLAALANQLPALAENADLRGRLEAVVALRHQTLGQTLADALFWYEEQYDHYRVRQWEIQQDASLSVAEKQAQLQALQLTAPAGLLEREQSTLHLQQARQLRSQYAPENSAALYSARADLFGADAAERLQQLDSQRQAWDQRYQHYRQEVAALKTSGLSQQDQQQQIDQLRQRHYDAQESQRVAALDRIHAAETP